MGPVKLNPIPYGRETQKLRLFRLGPELLQALLVEQGLTVCRFSVCVCMCVCKIISRPLIGRKYECSDWSTSISTALRTFLGKYKHSNSATYVPGEVLAFQQHYVRSWGSTSISTALRTFLGKYCTSISTVPR